MMRYAPAWYAMVFAPLLASASPAAAGLPPVRTHAELVEALIAAQPKSPDSSRAREERRDRALADLAKTSPDKVAVAKPIFDRDVQCSNEVAEHAASALLHAAAAKLTDAELSSLTEYYSGPAFTRLAILDDKANRSTAEDAELNTIRHTYPFHRFEEVTAEAAAAAPIDAIRQAFVACHDAAARALAAEGLSQ